MIISSGLEIRSDAYHPRILPFKTLPIFDFASFLDDTRHIPHLVSDRQIGAWQRDQQCMIESNHPVDFIKPKVSIPHKLGKHQRLWAHISQNAIFTGGFGSGSFKKLFYFKGLLYEYRESSPCFSISYVTNRNKNMTEMPPPPQKTPPQAPMAAWLASVLATWFGAGKLPRAPGTWGSLAAIPFAWGIFTYGGGTWGLVAGAGLLFIVGTWAADIYANAHGKPDPGEVVIDEVVGMWLTLAVVEPGLVAYGLGFVLFRLADILKPWPVSLADQQLKGGFGIMADDVLAAIYSAGGLWLAFHFWF